MIKENITMEQILPDVLTKPIEFRDHFIIKVPKQNTSFYLKKIESNAFSNYIESSIYLKRVNHCKDDKTLNELLLFQIDKILENGTWDEKLVELQRILKENDIIVENHNILSKKIPVSEPYTDDHNIEFRKYWTINYKKTKFSDYKETLDEQTLNFLKDVHENLLLNAKKAYESGHRFNSSAVISLKHKKIYEISNDSTNRAQYSINHSVMNLIKKFTKSLMNHTEENFLTKRNAQDL